ncbi:MAG: hypothetical protein R6V10_12445 [bacterium]
MKCQRCGLVHPPKAQVCRRCEIDLQTGEPRSRADSYLEVAGRSTGTTPIEKKKSRLKRKEKAETREPAESSSEETSESRSPAEKQGASVQRGRDLTRLLPGGSGSQAQVSCIQCTSFMEVKKEFPYSRVYPLLFLALGLVLAVAGLFVRLLFLPALAAVLAGLAYLGVGRSYWLCPSCGYSIEREDRPVRDMFSVGLNRKKRQRHPAIRAVGLVFNFLLVLLVLAALISSIAGVVSPGLELLFLILGIVVFWAIARIAADMVVRAALTRNA